MMVVEYGEPDLSPVGLCLAIKSEKYLFALSVRYELLGAFLGAIWAANFDHLGLLDPVDL
jgi:hypothetical protein